MWLEKDRCIHSRQNGEQEAKAEQSSQGTEKANRVNLKANKENLKAQIAKARKSEPDWPK
jgi:hypothetical protein